MKVINSKFEIPKDYNLTIDENGKYHFVYMLPNDEDGYGAGSDGPFDSELIASKKALAHFIEFG